MQYEQILWSETDGVAVLTINRPARMNSLDLAVLDEMLDAVARLFDGRSKARCLLLTGAGRGFCAGADLEADLGADRKGEEKDAGRPLETHFNMLIQRLFDLPVPLVTAVNGPAAGSGCAFALAGDIVVAAKSAYFVQSFVHVGLVPDAGSSWLLPRTIGRIRASRMLLLGDKIPADEAYAWGMVTEVVEDAALMARATEFAVRLAKGPTKALALTRHAIRDGMSSTLQETLLLERQNQRTAGRTADFSEGVAAFLEKRPAWFRGA